MPQQFFCKKCTTTKRETEFYGSNNTAKYPEGKIDLCKDCATMRIDNWEPETYLWLLEECDVPYVPKEWHKLLSSYANNPDKLTGKKVFFIIYD